MIEETNPLIGIVQIANSLVNALAIPKRMTEIEKLMQKDLVCWLTQEEFFAYGFPVFPKPLRVPRLIICDFWINAEINWDSEIAEDANLKFQRIRIIDPEVFPKIERRPKIGRKSFKPLIYCAIEEILKNNQHFKNETNKKKAEQIRNYLISHHPKINPYGPGLGDDAIRKHVNSFFREKFNK